jgi:hypothetical protein
MRSLRRLPVSCSPASAAGERGAVSSVGQIGEIDTLHKSAESARWTESGREQEQESADFAELPFA